MKVMKVMKVMNLMKAGGLWKATASAKRILACITYITSITFITAATAAAAEPEKFGAPQAAERIATPGAGSLVQVTLSLMLVLAAVFAAAWLVRRVKTFGKFGSGPIEIVADVAIGAKERAVLVQIGGKQLLLGVAPGHVSTLHVLEENVEVNRGSRMADRDVLAPNTPPDFKSILKRSLGL